MNRRRYPTLEEIGALERAARRARARALARMFVAFVIGMKTLFVRGAAVLAAKAGRTRKPARHHV